jgi:hypothetical protein
VPLKLILPRLLRVPLPTDVVRMVKKKHHYVPRTYLSGFTDSEGNLWNYFKDSIKKPVPRPPGSVCYETFYYAQEGEGGELDNSLEDAFSESVENRIPSLIEPIPTSPGTLVQMSREDRADFAFFVAVSLTRVPSFRSGIDRIHSRVAQMVLDHEAEKDAELRGAIERLGIKAEAKPSGSLRPMLDMAGGIAKTLLTKPWVFFCAPPGFSFATSDNPVWFSGRGPGHPLTELLMPLRSDLAWAAIPRATLDDMKVVCLTKFEARAMNRRVAGAARERVLLREFSEEFDAMVKKFMRTEQRVDL